MKTHKISLRFIRPYAAATIVALMVVVPGCGRPINRTAERRIRDALPGYIGPARVWRAHVDNPAEPRLESDTRLRFDPDRMRVVGLRIPLPASALKWLANRLSQGFDFSTLPFPVRIHRFTAESGHVIIEGEADILPSLNERLAATSIDLGPLPPPPSLDPDS